MSLCAGCASSLLIPSHETNYLNLYDPYNHIFEWKTRLLFKMTWGIGGYEDLRMVREDEDLDPIPQLILQYNKKADECLYEGVKEKYGIPKPQFRVLPVQGKYESDDNFKYRVRKINEYLAYVKEAKRDVKVDSCYHKFHDTAVFLAFEREYGRPFPIHFYYYPNARVMIVEFTNQHCGERETSFTFHIFMALEDRIPNRKARDIILGFFDNLTPFTRTDLLIPMELEDDYKHPGHDLFCSNDPLFVDLSKPRPSVSQNFWNVNNYLTLVPQNGHVMVSGGAMEYWSLGDGSHKIYRLIPVGFTLPEVNKTLNQMKIERRANPSAWLFKHVDTLPGVQLDVRKRGQERTKKMLDNSKNVYELPSLETPDGASAHRVPDRVPTGNAPANSSSVKNAPAAGKRDKIPTLNVLKVEATRDTWAEVRIDGGKEREITLDRGQWRLFHGKTFRISTDDGGSLMLYMNKGRLGKAGADDQPVKEKLFGSIPGGKTLPVSQ